MIKTVPKKKNCKKTKWLPEEALSITEKRRKAKGKGEKERYTHLNAEFQRMPRKEKKAFLSKQGKEIEENDRMGKTRDLFKKIRNMKGTFHVKIGTVQLSSVAQLCPTLRPHGLQHNRPPCPSPTPGVYSNSCPSSW